MTTSSLPKIQEELMALSVQERLQLAHWLIDSVVAEHAPSQEARAGESGGSHPAEEAKGRKALLAIAGLFAGGPGDTAERAEEILEAEVKTTSGFSIH